MLLGYLKSDWLTNIGGVNQGAVACGWCLNKGGISNPSFSRIFIRIPKGLVVVAALSYFRSRGK